jgi:hypothetical protein
VKKRVGAVLKRAGATEKMMMTTVIVAVIEEALVIVEASMMKTMMKEITQGIAAILQAETMTTIIQ